MKRISKAAFLALAFVGLMASMRSAWAAEESGELLEGPEWKILGLVTGFHSVHHKKSGLEVRLLEADGSASVAHDPVALYLLVTNNGTADSVEHTWRLTRGVARVRGLSVTGCGVDVQVDVDRFNSEGEPHGSTRKKLRLCFLSSDTKLQTTLKVSEISR
jgi:hypothetical protein